jgi:hypothetical protein
VSHDGAQVGLGTGGNVIWGASIEHAVQKLAIDIPIQQSQPTYSGCFSSMNSRGPWD